MLNPASTSSCSTCGIKTSVTKLINMNMIVATLNMNGWYLLKENGSNTDLDFIHKDGRIDELDGLLQQW